MSSPVTINPDANPYSGPNVSFNVRYDIDGEKLTVVLAMAFTPFDFRQYKWNLFSNTVGVRSTTRERTTSLYTNNEKLNWLKNTIYNYVPFGFCMACQTGLYNSFGSATFKELSSWDLELENFTHVYKFGPKTETRDIIETEFKVKSKECLKSDDEWYSTIFGQSFNFNYALNANKFFSFYKPKDGSKNFDSSESFDECLLEMNNGDERLISENLMWDDSDFRRTANQNVVELTATAEADRAHDRTYAVVAANPFSREIYTKFIGIEALPATPPQPQYQIEYVEDSIQISNGANKLCAECDGSVNNININIRKENAEDNGWQTLNPRISFKVRKIQV